MPVKYPLARIIVLPKGLYTPQHVVLVLLLLAFIAVKGRVDEYTLLRAYDVRHIADKILEPRERETVKFRL